MRKHVIVKGRVTGVGFRSLVKRIAFETGVRGFVKNVGNEVEAHAEGMEKQVQDFLKRINVKSTSFIGINVEEIIEAKCGCKGFDGFKILF